MVKNSPAKPLWKSQWSLSTNKKYINKWLILSLPKRDCSNNNLSQKNIKINQLGHSRGPTSPASSLWLQPIMNVKGKDRARILWRFLRIPHDLPQTKYCASTDWDFLPMCSSFFNLSSLLTTLWPRDLHINYVLCEKVLPSALEWQHSSSPVTKNNNCNALILYLGKIFTCSVFNIVWLHSTGNRKNFMVLASSCLLKCLFRIR